MKASKIVTTENASTVKLVIEYIMGAPRIVDPIAERLYMLSTAVEKAEAETLEVPTFVRRYLENKGLSCMHCDEGNVEGHGPEFEMGQIEQKVQCTDCGRIWIDIYKLSDVAFFAEEED